jgi:hypothetical protein
MSQPLVMEGTMMPTESLPRRIWTAIARTTPGIDADGLASSDSPGQLRNALARTPESTGLAKVRYLLPEDRPDYERLLDQALREPELRALMGEPADHQLSPEQLRTLALNAQALITVSAAQEYKTYITLRERDRVTQGRAEFAGERGAGLQAVVTVLVPVLAGTASLLLLSVGYLLRLVSTWPVARPLVTGGWVLAAVTAVAIVAAAVGLLLAALRNAAAEEASGVPPSEDVLMAREAWQEALLERGIRPFLRQCLASDH